MQIVASAQKADLAPEAEVASPPQAQTLAKGCFTVLITGSTKGIGRALAEQFLQEGDNVVITSRSADSVAETVKELGSKYGTCRVVGIPCNVCKGPEVASLADIAKKAFGKIDIWINNAGTNAYYYGPLSDASEADLASIVETNVLGVMLCCREAIRVMKDQQGGGHIFNMDGAGADGNATPRFAAYGATKRGLQQFSKSLQVHRCACTPILPFFLRALLLPSAIPPLCPFQTIPPLPCPPVFPSGLRPFTMNQAELEMQNIKDVVVHNLSPGMVTTELLMSGANTPQAKWFINCLAEPAQEVAAFLVPKVRQVPRNGGGSGPVKPTYIQFLTKAKAFSQIAGRAILGLRKDRFVPED